LKLLRPGGIIAFDNTLWAGKVLPDDPANDDSTRSKKCLWNKIYKNNKCRCFFRALRALNEKLAKDVARAFVVQLKVGDGLTLAVKL